MKRLTLLAATACVAAFSAPAWAQMPDIDVPYTEFTLDNGLRVVVQEDHKAPIVAVSIWYHVGSKNEPTGKTGFAHLFEHLMFNGSENYNDEYFKPFEAVGATGMNGTTWLDRTNYFETVPTPAVDMALWMESDRMGHLVGAIDQAKLDEQRGVVQNEKRQGDNRPYGMAEYQLQYGTFPEGHPYHHTTIGSMADLDAASLDDVKGWFKKYYGAANAVLVLAGDIDPKTAKAKAEKYFGDIAAGANLPHMKQWVPVKEENVAETMTDEVPQARVYRTWAIPGRTTKDEALLDLAADILGSGKNSRLYKDLVYDKQIATAASAYIERHELSSVFYVEVTAKPGVDPKKITDAIDAVTAEFFAKGPTRDELKRVQTQINASMVRGIEQIGGWSGKAVRLAQGALYADDPGYFMTRLQWQNDADTRAVQYAFREWLGHGYYQLTVNPAGKHKTIAGVDRKKGVPAVGDLPDLKFPTVQTATLENGMKVVLAERHTVPVVDVAIQFDAGYAADQGKKLGTSSFAMEMMDEGAGKYDALQLSAKLEELGADLSTDSTLDTSTVELSALKENLKPSLDLMADVLLQPTYSQEEMDRMRKSWIAKIGREKSQPVQTALRLLPPIMYGKDHAYGVPFTGSGTVKSIESLNRDDLVSFHDTWLRPDNGTLFVVGDTTMDEMLPILNKEFGKWTAPETPKPTKNLAQVAERKQGKVILIDKKDAPQTLILGGELIPSSAAEDYLATETMNDVLGGQFTARVNMNLREDKHWAYGAYTFTRGAKAQRPLFVYAPVQADKTGPSVKELLKEMNDIKGARPATPEEVKKVVDNNSNALPGQFETAHSVLNSLLSSNRYGRPFDYPATLKAQYAALNADTVNAETSKVRPNELVWVLVGDLSKVEPQLADIGFQHVEIWDADGNKLKDVEMKADAANDAMPESNDSAK